jgi:uncharacterized alkaline shock family protein YloU
MLQGDIQISKSVIESISDITLAEIDGIYTVHKIKISGKLFNSIANDALNLTIDIYIGIKTGFKIKTIAAQAQRLIIYNVENMTGLKADKINIYVDDIVEV